jgi:hypothetical protein
MTVKCRSAAALTSQHPDGDSTELFENLGIARFRIGNQGIVERAVRPVARPILAGTPNAFTSNTWRMSWTEDTPIGFKKTRLRQA